MERDEALLRLNTLVGTDLRALAVSYNVTIFAEGKLNKGWAGHTIERFLGLALNSSQAPNFGSWELMVIPLKQSVTGPTVKETMAITMIDPYEVEHKEFEESHLFSKLQKIIVVARIWESLLEQRSLVHAVAPFDLDNPSIYNQVKADYDAVRETIQTKGFAALSGKRGVLVQPRTKGPGHGSTSRAFYARTGFVAHILDVGRTLQPPVQP